MVSCSIRSPGLGLVEDTCKKWSQGRWLDRAGAFGDLADDPTARSTFDPVLNLANAEISGGGERLDLSDDSFLGRGTSQVLSSGLGRFHPRGTPLAGRRRFQF